MNTRLLRGGGALVRTAIAVDSFGGTLRLAVIVVAALCPPATGVAIGHLVTAMADGRRERVLVSVAVLVLIRVVSDGLAAVSTALAARQNERIDAWASRTTLSSSVDLELDELDDAEVRNTLMVAAGRSPLLGSSSAGVQALFDVTGTLITAMAAAVVVATWSPVLAGALVAAWAVAARAGLTTFDYLAAAAKGSTQALKPYLLGVQAILRRSGSEESRALGARGQLESAFGSAYESGFSQAWVDHQRAVVGMIAWSLPALGVTLFALMKIADDANSGVLQIGRAAALLLNVIGVGVLADPSSFRAIGRGAQVVGAVHQLSERAKSSGRDGQHRTSAPTIACDSVFVELKDRSSPLVADVSFRVAPNELVAIVGANGAGKSTLLRVLSGLRSPTQGNVRVDGSLVKDARDRLAFLPQESLRLGCTVRQFVGSFASSISDVEIVEALRLVGLDELSQDLNRRLSRDYEGGLDLSGGEWQRLNLARLVVAASQRDAIMLDEPTAQLDSRGVSQWLAALSRLRQSRTILLVSHDRRLVEYADRVLWMSGGELAASGPHHQLLAERPAYAVFWRQVDAELQS